MKNKVSDFAIALQAADVLRKNLDMAAKSC